MYKPNMGTIYALIRRAVYIKQQAGVGFLYLKTMGQVVCVCVCISACMDVCQGRVH
jgi:hypothetical protein